MTSTFLILVFLLEISNLLSLECYSCKSWQKCTSVTCPESEQCVTYAFREEAGLLLHDCTDNTLSDLNPLFGVKDLDHCRNINKHLFSLRRNSTRQFCYICNEDHCNNGTVDWNNLPMPYNPARKTKCYKCFSTNVSECNTEVEHCDYDIFSCYQIARKVGIIDFFVYRQGCRNKGTFSDDSSYCRTDFGDPNSKRICTICEGDRCNEIKTQNINDLMMVTSPQKFPEDETFSFQLPGMKDLKCYNCEDSDCEEKSRWKVINCSESCGEFSSLQKAKYGTFRPSYASNYRGSSRRKQEYKYWRAKGCYTIQYAAKCSDSGIDNKNKELECNTCDKDFCNSYFVLSGGVRWSNGYTALRVAVMVVAQTVLTVFV